MDRFGWCTWDAFYLTVDPAGVWRGVSELAGAGLPPRFLIIDDGWQSVNRDGDPSQQEDAPGLVLGGDQMTARLYRFDECARFRAYREGALLRRPPEQFYDAGLPRAVIRKAAEIENAEKAKKKAERRNGGAAADELSEFDARIARLRQELDQLLTKKESMLAKLCSENDGNSAGAGETTGLKAFLKDMRVQWWSRGEGEGEGSRAASGLLGSSKVKPKWSFVDGREGVFEWENGGKGMVDVTWKQEKNGVSEVVFCY